MPGSAHEVPTHLSVEDRVLLGLTVRQCLYLLVGCSAGYGLWTQLSAAADLVRIVCVVLCAGLAACFALVRPADRPLEEWLAAGLLFVASPRHAAWRVEDPLTEDWRPVDAAWHELIPQPVWTAETEA